MVDMDYVIEAYGFVIPFNKEVSFQEFADLISETFSLENKRNKAVFEFVKSQRGRIKRGVIATQCVYE